MLPLPQAKGQAAKSSSVRLNAVNASERIVLSWATDFPADAYYIYRAQASPAGTFAFLDSVSGTDSQYVDSAAPAGLPVEYQVFRVRNGNLQASGYVLTGRELPPVEHQGGVLLVIDSLANRYLPASIDQWAVDLWCEGWQVRRLVVPPHYGPDRIRDSIQAYYQQAPLGLRAVVLLGDVAVPYSGGFDVPPDGHPEHNGAWPADVYYGSMSMQWSDQSVNNDTSAYARNKNVPGDGKWDPSFLDRVPELMVGRIDLSDLPAYSESEYALLARYLQHNHRYRRNEWRPSRRGILQDQFSAFSEGFSQTAWRSFSAAVGKQKVSDTAGYLKALQGDTPLFSYGAGPGTFTQASQVAQTQDFAQDTTLSGAFTFLFGSYFGDWDTTDNFLRAPLAAHRPLLTNAWSGRPIWFVHHMARGLPIGESLLATQANGLGAPRYLPTGSYAGGVHVALQGDPTLRLPGPAPLERLQAVFLPDKSRTELRWPAAHLSELRYAIYRQDSAGQGFTRLHEGFRSDTFFVDRNPYADRPNVYMLRPVAEQTNASGTFPWLGCGLLDTLPHATPRLGFSTRDCQASEGETASVTISLSSASSESIEVALSISAPAPPDNVALGEGKDFRLLRASVRIPAGASSFRLDTAVLSLVDDSLNEPSESFVLRLDSVLKGSAHLPDSTQALSFTILDNDTLPAQCYAVQAPYRQDFERFQLRQGFDFDQCWYGRGKGMGQIHVVEAAQMQAGASLGDQQAIELNTPGPGDTAVFITPKLAHLAKGDKRIRFRAAFQDTGTPLYVAFVDSGRKPGHVLRYIDTLRPGRTGVFEEIRLALYQRPEVSKAERLALVRGPGGGAIGIDDFVYEGRQPLVYQNGGWNHTPDTTSWGLPGRSLSGQAVLDRPTAFRRLRIAAEADMALDGQSLIADTVFLMADASGTAEIRGPGQVEAYVLAQQYIDGSPGWRYLGSPIAEATLASLDDDVPLFFSSQTANVYYFDEQAGGSRWNEGWRKAGARTDSMGRRGFAVYIGQQGSGVRFPLWLDMGGEVRMEDHILRLTRNQAGNPATRGWNLIANPFPASLDWSGLALPPGVNANAYVWDPAAGNYRALLQGGIETRIAPFQGFFVQLAAGTAASLRIPPEATTTGGSFYKGGYPTLRLSVSSGQGSRRDWACVQFRSQVQDSLRHPTLDATQLPSPVAEAPRLFTRKGGDSLAVHTLSGRRASYRIPLHFSSARSGAYVLGMETHAWQGRPVWLEDTQTGRRQPLDRGYAFHHHPGNAPDRFVLWLGAATSGAPPENPQQQDVRVWVESETLRIAGAEAYQAREAQVVLFDTAGRQVLRCGLQSRIVLPAFPPGVYLYRLQSSGLLQRGRLLLH